MWPLLTKDLFSNKLLHGIQRHNNIDPLFFNDGANTYPFRWRDRDLEDFIGAETLGFLMGQARHTLLYRCIFCKPGSPVDTTMNDCLRFRNEFLLRYSKL
ncbi:hypothetical protein SFRURICE_021078 [Spodoptera frugiperda]|nr:hypothetical protein SFRURICE_021078 [Spodoptera frugiperda]